MRQAKLTTNQTKLISKPMIRLTGPASFQARYRLPVMPASVAARSMTCQQPECSAPMMGEGIETPVPPGELRNAPSVQGNNTRFFML